jgi:antitoxin PrlF
MATVLEKDAKITAQGQTTVPAPVRERLGVVPGDHITFAVDALGNVTLRRADDDPAIEAFLDFLAVDIQNRPDQVRGLTDSLEGRLRELTSKTRIDRQDDCISGDVGL